MIGVRPAPFALRDVLESLRERLGGAASTGARRDTGRHEAPG